MEPSLQGLYVPLITPFTDDGELAPDALEKLAHDVIDAAPRASSRSGPPGSPPRSPPPSGTPCSTSSPGSAVSAAPR